MKFVCAPSCDGRVLKASVKVMLTCVSLVGSHYPPVCIFPTRHLKKKDNNNPLYILTKLSHRFSLCRSKSLPGKLEFWKGFTTSHLSNSATSLSPTQKATLLFLGTSELFVVGKPYGMLTAPCMQPPASPCPWHTEADLPCTLVVFFFFYSKDCRSWPTMCGGRLPFFHGMQKLTYYVQPVEGGNLPLLSTLLVLSSSILGICF